MTGILAGKVALVTGASSGIGWAVAEALAEGGASVVVNARRDEKLNALVKSIEKRGGKATAIAGDAAQQGVKEIMKGAEAWAQGLGGNLDIVVVNAGRGLAGGVVSSDEGQWDEMFKVNILGAARLMRYAAQGMIKRGKGDIVVLGSVSGHHISPFSGLYGASKWAIWGAAEALRREVCGKGVRVTTIKPGVVISEFQEVAGYGPEFSKTVERFGKCLEPADVARTIRFVVEQPRAVHLNEIVIRPTGQDYP